jgi:hypothetical protein
VFFFRNFDFITFALAQYALLPFDILSAIYVFILLSALKMESRKLKFSTLQRSEDMTVIVIPLAKNFRSISTEYQLRGS